MNRIKAFAVASGLGLLAVAFVPARADEWNKKTILTVNEPVALPNTTLQPGKYVMKLMDSPSNRHIVQVFDENEQKLITTILAIPNEKLRPADNTSFSYWETAAGQPRALRSWFYPGDTFGQEFAYPKETAMKIAKATNENVPAIMNDTTDVTKAEVGTITPSGEAQEMSAQSSGQQATEHSSTTAAVPTPQSGTASSETAQSSATASASAAPADQNVHAMPQNQPGSTAPAQTDSAASTSSTDSMSASADNSSAQAGVSANTPAGSVDHPMSARNELPQTASPLPLAGLAGLAAAGAALAARVAGKR